MSGLANIVARVAIAVLGLVATACETFETGYFEHRVHEVTQEVVQRRYGPPHKKATVAPDQEMWIYFDRGSGMSGYTGYARVPPCSEYHLTFDREGILRDWAMVSCRR